jgi:acyl-CoA thioesterase
MPMIDPFAQRLIDSDESVRQRFGFDVVNATDGSCQRRAVIDAGWLNGAGFIHGGVCYALMDSACAYACASRQVLGVTTNGNITYVKGAKSGRTLFATATVLSQSRRVMSLTAHVHDEQDLLLAHGSFLFQLRPSGE